MNYGKMDKFDLETGGNVNGDYLAYSQLYQADIPNYFAYASAFTLADQMFVSLHGPRSRLASFSTSTRVRGFQRLHVPQVRRYTDHCLKLRLGLPFFPRLPRAASFAGFSPGANGLDQWL